MASRKILVCCGTGCLANNSFDIYTRFLEKLKDTNTEVIPEIKATGCNGLCEKGPVVKILPDEISYFKVKAKDVDEIVSKTILKGEIIDRLLYFDTNSKKKIVSHKDASFYKHQHKIALRNIGEIDPKNIEDYKERNGFEALRKVLFEMTPDEVITEVEKSGLRGRGGAGFPTGSKWRTCSKYDNYPKYVVCNGDEGDPGAFMDRSIMEGDPNTVIEGMIICGYAINSNRGFLYIRDEYQLARENMQTAINNARKHGFLGKNILGSGFDFDLEIVRGGGAFVCGESSALMASIEGNVGEPRAKYIRSVEKGLWDKPTVLNNVETWANIPPIILNGAQWFKQIGTEKNSGTKVFSLVGKVKNTGLVEIPMGTTLRELVFDIGGGIIKDRPFKAAQTGGPSGGCIPAEYLDISLDFDNLSRIGSMMGSGGVIVMDDTTCMVELARYYMEFLSEESCGKCTTCREGINTMLNILNRITLGQGREEDIDLLISLSETIKDASLCGLGKTAPNPVMTTLKYFRDEYMEHIVDKRCPAGVCKNLTSYSIDPDTCIGCSACARKCPVNAIEGELKKPHVIHKDKCIKCGTCFTVCPSGAVKIGGGLIESYNK
ncbi:MAG TPA: NADH-ubiquinone oxidoreductase-F iron-sulfur binding region domain-containing protein [Sedimentibacter sp.]|nr:4Fe-4S binding protein [Sedimentibacter sp.]HHY99957.1 4Fe-4S binding protein [Tissierellia bacterium]HOK48998.1 NADH-ubiquinone oxidoreductase-F iron-sulfur binding region domain-containing protein [Sedimentibacter sp.]HOW22457.1 NADH-ubiquinone oxidoreductase-F iron-sulfur binding region domain-containing protein [Sedimentibacter sp.]HRC81375.1 NADH-ubiquinone oxidoreductase-F iron-sulfur binding region domain-containing protein [Sedimentibacter sp.]